MALRLNSACQGCKHSDIYRKHQCYETLYLIIKYAVKQSSVKWMSISFCQDQRCHDTFCHTTSITTQWFPVFDKTGLCSTIKSWWSMINVFVIRMGQVIRLISLVCVCFIKDAVGSFYHLLQRGLELRTIRGIKPDYITNNKTFAMCDLFECSVKAIPLRLFLFHVIW